MKKFIIYYFLFLFFLLSFFSSGVIDSQDGFQYLSVARNIYYKGEPTAPMYEYDKRKNIHMSVIEGKDGKIYSLTSLGFSLAYLPAVAITDMVYKFYGISPEIHFPLENDWLIFLTASFTNSFFGALVGVILFAFLLELSLSKKEAMLISFIGLFATNLLVYTKNSFPHMMFICFLLISFYVIKLHFKTKKKSLLFLSGMSYGMTAIIYSFASVLSALPLFSYLFFLSKPQPGISFLRNLLVKGLFLFLGFLPFMLIYIWFENVRATPITNFSTPSAAATAISWFSKVPVGVFIEGLFGQLFSPGRSIFLYSPVLLLPILFWFKLRKKIFPELLSFLLMSAIYILFYASVYRVGGADQGISALWHGENSWGPRYLTPLIPMGMLLVGTVYISLSKKAKYLIFLPLVLLGFYIEILGVTLPYQIKLHDLQEKFFLNGTEYKAADYSNFLPRYSPVLNMSKKLAKLRQNFPKTFDHGIYNVRFYDGIDFTFPVGGERWRVIEGRGYISFDNLKEEKVEKFTFGMINHPIADSSSAAELSFVLNNQLLSEKPVTLKVGERNIFTIPVDQKYIK
ncbi:MAG: hypothetical protein Q8Q91_01220, partial [Candidatus Daviesbacteria bacterium]|nr:hypothetical protein [Candidatus Daviesbacteria bacterium]